MSIKYLIGVAIVLASTTTWADHHKSNELSPNIISAKAGYDAFASGDMEAWKATHSPDAVWTVLEGLPYAGTYVGPESVVENVFTEIASCGQILKLSRWHFTSLGIRYLSTPE